MNVGSHLTKRALLDPGLEALVDIGLDVRYTFAELDERANQTAHVLAELGLSKGDRVAVLLPNGHNFVEIFYGAARAGLIVVPLNLRLVADELAFLLRDSGATAVVFHSDHDAVVLDLLGRGKADNVGSDVNHWLRVGSNCQAWAFDLEALVDRAPADPLVVQIDGSEPVFIMYTSGTAGFPKGVVHTHDSLQWAVPTTLASVDVRYRDRYLISLPLFHVGAQPDGVLYLPRHDDRSVEPVRPELHLGRVP